LGDDQREQAASFGMHPALLDGALHAGELVLGDASTDEGGGTRLPFSFGTARLYARGASSLRVCLTPLSDEAVSILITDDTGQPITTIDSLLTRNISPAQLGTTQTTHHDSLFNLNWKMIPVPPGSTTPSEVVVVLGEE